MEERQNISGQGILRDRPPAIDPIDRENQLASMAIDSIERKIKSDKAPTALLLHYAKLVSTREQLEKKKLEKEIALLEAKKEAAESAARIEELYSGAIEAMTSYGRSINKEDAFDYGEVEG